MNPRMNQCLEMLPENVFQLLLPHLNLRSLRYGETLYEAFSRPNKLYFPINTLIQLRKNTPDGLFIDVATVGRESLIGLAGLIGVTYFQPIVAVSGFAYEIDRTPFELLIDSQPTISKMETRSSQVLLRKMAKELICNHYHPIDQRVSRWILTRQDHMKDHQLVVTHQAIADSLGIRREAVTMALGHLKGVEVLRGHLDILDRTLVEQHCCECYHHLKEVRPNQISVPF